MEKSFKIFVIGFVMSIGLSAFMSKPAIAQGGVSISFQTFYDELSPYGAWIDDPTYGYVWSPDVGQGFHPYGTDGHWMVTEYGNTWVSDYDWGWAPFHYGRWKYDDYYGWIWIPGYEWGPAWVSWRSGGGYYGWAPLSPGISIGVSIRLPLRHWLFVPQRYIVHRNIYDYCAPYRRRSSIYHHTTIINNIYVRNHNRYAYGPSIYNIERVTHRRVNVYNINNSYRPSRSVAGRGSLNMYRPSVSRGNSGNARPRPKYASTSVRPRNSEGNRPQVRGGSNNRPEINGSRPRAQVQRRPSSSNGSGAKVGKSSRVSPSSRPQVRQQPKNRPQVRPSSRPTRNRPSVRPSSRPQVRQQPKNRPQVRPSSRTSPGGSQAHRPNTRPSVKRDSRPAARPSVGQHSRPQVRKATSPSPRVQRKSRPAVRQHSRPAVKQSRPAARPQTRTRPQRVSKPQSRQPQKASAHRPSSKSPAGKSSRPRPRP